MPEYEGPDGVEATTVDASSVFEIDGGRVTTLDIETSAPIASIRILEQPEHGHISVNPDNSLAMVMTGSDYSGGISARFEITYEDGAVEAQTLDMQVTEPAQEAGWGTGEQHYMLAEDEDGDIIVETGDAHRKVYLTEGDHGLTRADIAAREGLDESDITNQWLKSHSEYGATEDMALSTDAGLGLWKALNPEYSSHSNWLLFEKGYTYDDVGTLVHKGVDGESELNPIHITSWGEGDRPEIGSFVNVVHASDNVVFSGLTLTNGMRLVTNSENWLLHDVTITEDELIVQNMTGFTLHDSEIHHVHRDELSGNEHADRISGIFAANTDGILLEGSVFHHNGWEDGYLDGEGQAPSKYSHNVYLQWNTTDVTFRDNIVSQGASFGAQFRGGAFAEDNVFVDNNAAINLFGGNYGGREYLGNFSFLADNLITSGGNKSAENIGALTMGIGNYGLDTGMVDNIIAHLANPDDAYDVASKEFGHNAYQGADTFYDDTVIYNWVGTRNSDRVDTLNKNVDTADPDAMMETTIQRFAAELLGDANASITDLMDYILSLPDTAFDDSVTAEDIIAYFQEGFGLTPDGSEAEIHRFVPNDVADGVRWDNRVNWNSDETPDDGDDVILGGNKVEFGGTSRVGDLSLGDFGALDVNNGRLTVEGDLTAGAAGAAISTQGAGQFWTNGYSDDDQLNIDVDGGRFVNTGDIDGAVDMQITEGQAVLATEDATYEVGAGQSLEIEGSTAQVGFDGSDGENAALILQNNSTLTFDSDKSGFSAIEEFHSGALGDATDVGSGMALNGKLEIDITDLDEAVGTHKLIDVDALRGMFDDIHVEGLGNKLSATLTFDYDEDSLMLEITEGTGVLEVVSVGSALEGADEEQDLWELLTDGQGTFESSSAAAAAAMEQEEDAIPAHSEWLA